MPDNTIEEGNDEKVVGRIKVVNGKSAYDILKMPGCPIRLPTARSMTQARIDYEFLEDSIFEWYHNTHKPPIK